MESYTTCWQQVAHILRSDEFAVLNRQLHQRVIRVGAMQKVQDATGRQFKELDDKQQAEWILIHPSLFSLIVNPTEEQKLVYKASTL